MSIVPLNFGAAPPLRLKPHFVHVAAVSGFCVPQFGQNTLVPSFPRDGTRDSTRLTLRGQGCGGRSLHAPPSATQGFLYRTNTILCVAVVETVFVPLLASWAATRDLGKRHRGLEHLTGSISSAIYDELIDLLEDGMSAEDGQLAQRWDLPREFTAIARLTVQTTGH